ncbi:MAG TPA: transposase [Acidimicrobiia bacterium]|nr:transposase [Acidimicrobiia bacterium]
MELLALGPLEGRADDGSKLSLGGARRRAVLATLLIRAGESVAVDRIVEDVWADKIPANPKRAVQVAISRLRTQVGAERLLSRANGYVLRVGPDELDTYRHLEAAPAGLSGAEGDARSAVTLALVAVVRTLNSQIKGLNRLLDELLDQHPDGHIFRSLPRFGTIRAATLLAEIGDCRARFPTPEALASLAGVAPSTRTSGRHRSVTFRWSSNTRLRNALCDFAGDTRNGNEWARQRYDSLRADGKSHPHAERILARTWTQIIWRCWQDHVPYDPTRHRALQRLQQQRGLT